jgi:CRP-like cAMP-binding protein
MFAVSRPEVVRNRILAALPHQEFARMQPHLERVHLEKGEVIYISGDNIRYAYFPDDGLLSLLSTTESGSTVEVAMVGNEGVVGLSTILKNRVIPYEVIVQLTTEAFRIRAEALQEEFSKGQALQELILRYLNVLITQISQASICNRFHTLETALSRWLLIAQDRVNLDALNLTQEIISHALGVPRTGVTTAAGALQRAGLIRYSRGKIVILDRGGLEANSCECYRILHHEFHHFIEGISS